MAGSSPFVLPQYQGSMYDLQRQQALAQALMQGAMTPQQSPQATGSGQYTVMPRASALGPISQIAQGLLANKVGSQASQGMNQLGQQQWGSLMSMLGGGAGGQSPQLNPGSADGGVGGAGNAVANPFTGSDGGDGSASAASGPVNGVAAGPQLANNVGGGSSPLNPLGMNPGMAAMMMMQSPDKYWESQAAAYKPADIVQQIRAAGIDPNSTLGHQLAQQALAKANYIAPTSLRPGGYAVYADGREEQLPQVPEGFTAQRGPNGWQIVPVQGGAAAMSASAAAKAGGQAQYQLHEVWDPTANGGQGGFVQQSVANVANAANGTPGGGASAPLGIRNNNPGNRRPGGNFAQYPDMQTGLAALDKNLQSYGSQGVNTISGVISKWAPPNENDTQGYIKEVSQRLGVSPNQKIDLSNPLVRQSLSTAIALRENGPSGVFGSGGSNGASSAPQGGPMASQPPLGAANAANASQGAPSKQMADSYGAMSTADASYQQSREALNEMISLANNKGASGTAVGLLPEGVSTRISPDAAKYQKLHATYVAQQGKALGSGGTDAARATIDEAVPTYDKPQSAMISGLKTQLNNLDLSHLKTQFLTPLYQQGNEKAFTQQSAAFDQNIKPAMIPALQLSGDAQRAAVQSAVKADPSLRSSFEWAFNNGMLK